MKTTETPALKCPHCGYAMDMTSSIGEDAQPSPGDFTLCIECGEVAVFTDAMTLRQVSLAERDSWSDDTRSKILSVQDAIHQRSVEPSKPTHPQCPGGGA